LQIWFRTRGYKKRSGVWEWRIDKRCGVRRGIVLWLESLTKENEWEKKAYDAFLPSLWLGRVGGHWIRLFAVWHVLWHLTDSLLFPFLNVYHTFDGFHLG
jgi:hypothetical protein